MLTLFHPATGQVRVKGITTCPNTVLHEWLQEQLTHILALLPAPLELSPAQNRERWQHWQEGLQLAPSIGEDMPPLRLLLVLDNLSGHHTPSFVMWLGEHGIMPLYTPLGGSWLNMAESVQRIIVRRALDGEYPSTPQQIIDWMEQTAEGWNADPTPFVWGGKRKRGAIERETDDTLWAAVASAVVAYFALTATWLHKGKRRDKWPTSRFFHQEAC